LNLALHLVPAESVQKFVPLNQEPENPFGRGVGEEA